MTDETVDEVERLLQLADHVSTPAALRARLHELQADATWSARRAFERFEELALPILAGLPVELPQTTLYRAQSLPTFLRHCTRAPYRALDAETFRRRLERSDDPHGLLDDALDRDATVFPRRRSWMVAAPTDEILRATGDELARLLELGQQRPPFALCVMPRARLVEVGVMVRTPTAADAALGRHDYWHPEGLAAGPEFVDLDVPGAAVEEVLWRP